MLLKRKIIVCAETNYCTTTALSLSMKVNLAHPAVKLSHAYTHMFHLLLYKIPGKQYAVRISIVTTQLKGRAKCGGHTLLNKVKLDLFNKTKTNVRNQKNYTTKVHLNQMTKRRD